MINPYRSPKTDTNLVQKIKVHPDWKWMALGVYAICCICMFGVIGKTNTPGSSVFGFGHGFIGAPAALGTAGFVIAIPLLALLPTVLVACPFRYFYRTGYSSQRTTLANFMMLVLAIVVAIINASLYRGD